MGLCQLYKDAQRELISQFFILNLLQDIERRACVILKQAQDDGFVKWGTNS